jgi:hypothetical protein
MTHGGKGAKAGSVDLLSAVKARTKSMEQEADRSWQHWHTAEGKEQSVWVR